MPFTTIRASLTVPSEHADAAREILEQAIDRVAIEGASVADSEVTEDSQIHRPILSRLRFIDIIEHLAFGYDVLRFFTRQVETNAGVPNVLTPSLRIAGKKRCGWTRHCEMRETPDLSYRSSRLKPLSLFLRRDTHVFRSVLQLLVS